MHSFGMFRVFFPALLFAGALGYFALRIWFRRKDNEAEDTRIDFRPSIGFTRLDGGAALALLLENRSDIKVWTEEIEILLTNLIANDQTCEATCHETHKVRQTIGPQDMVPVSVVETIYKAAGKPQRRYSCLMSSIVRYRAGDEWIEKAMPPYSLNMAGLTVANSRKERWNKSEFKAGTKLLQGPQLVGPK